MLNMLYKYYTPESYNFDAVAMEYFWYSKASKENDPNECDVRWLDKKMCLFNGKSAEETEKTYDAYYEIMKDYGVCCFSKECDNENMWAHYAANYCGFVVGYDEDVIKDDNPNVRGPILKLDTNYTSELICDNTPLPNLDGKTVHEALKEDPKNLEPLFQLICSTKNKKYWKQENEFRLFIGSVCTAKRVAGIKRFENGYKVRMQNNAIREIIIGHQMTKENRAKIKEIAENLNLNVVKQVVRKQPLKLDFEDINITDL